MSDARVEGGGVKRVGDGDVRKRGGDGDRGWYPWVFGSRWVVGWLLGCSDDASGPQGVGSVTNSGTRLNKLSS